MKSYPIIFSSPMVCALLEGRKTQTRRLITSQWANLKMHHDTGKRCALYVREAFRHVDEREDGGMKWIDYRATTKYSAEHPDAPKWKPSIHMPRWASRLTLEVTEVRKQRLQDISEDDAIAEGIESTEYYREEHPASICFSVMFDHIHGGELWHENPEVFAISFVVRRWHLSVSEELSS